MARGRYKASLADLDQVKDVNNADALILTVRPAKRARRCAEQESPFSTDVTFDQSEASESGSTEAVTAASVAATSMVPAATTTASSNIGEAPKDDRNDGLRAVHLSIDKAAATFVPVVNGMRSERTSPDSSSAIATGKSGIRDDGDTGVSSLRSMAFVSEFTDGDKGHVVVVEAVESTLVPAGDCPICMGDFAEGCMLVLCNAGHVCCPLCVLRTVREALGPSARVVHCPICFEEAKAALATAPPLLQPLEPSLSAFSVVKGLREGVDYFPAAAIHCAVVYGVHRWSQDVSARSSGSVHVDRGSGDGSSDFAAAASSSVAPVVDELEGVAPLSKEEMLRYARMQVESAVLPNGERTFTCPDPRCGEYMISDDPTPRRVTCLHCRKTELCGACGLDWARSRHGDFLGGPQSCAAAFNYEQSLAEAEILARGKDSTGTFKQCPKCRAGLTHYRGHGCHSIDCPNCTTKFCYACMRTDCKNCHTFCDDTCDCADCFDCAAGNGGHSKTKPLCKICFGHCPACQDAGNPEARESRHERQRKAYNSRAGPPCGSTIATDVGGVAIRAYVGRVAAAGGRYTIDARVAAAAAAAAARALQTAMTRTATATRLGFAGALRLAGTAVGVSPADTTGVAAAASAVVGNAATDAAAAVTPLRPPPPQKSKMLSLLSRLKG